MEYRTGAEGLIPLPKFIPARIEISFLRVVFASLVYLKVNHFARFSLEAFLCHLFAGRFIREILIVVLTVGKIDGIIVC